MTGTDAARRQHLPAVVAALALAFGLAACGGETGGGDAASEDAAMQAGEAAAMPNSFTVTGDFQTPESVLHDDVADVYLVSNINGSPLEKDDNGFISRVSPDGEVAELRWIDGAQEGVTLHAPKGLALKGDTLFVADIDTVRMFNRQTGAALGARGVQGATFLNDMAVGPDGAVYVTDSGLRAGAEGFEPTGTDAVYRFGPDGTAQAVAQGAPLANPNGIAVGDQGIWVVMFGSNAIVRLDPQGNVAATDSVPQGSLDGVVLLPDGSLLVSSWAGQAVYHHLPGQGSMTLVENVESPADIGYDARRGRVLIPSFMGNRVEVRPTH